MGLVDAHQSALAKVRAVTGNAADRTWLSLGSYNEADVALFVRRIVPIVGAAQRHAAALTAAYLARRLGLGSPAIDYTTVTGAAVRAGASPADVYRRPFVTTWTSLKNGAPFASAVEAGRARARSAAETDVQLSFRAAARDVMASDDRVVGYRRVPDGNACEFCLLASTQRYRTGDLLPLHNNCGCDVDPILGRRDPGHVIEKGVLSALKLGDVDQARVMYGERVAVHEHGELGPVLTAAGDQFTGPDDL